jgi:uncharacterized protein (UPF0276 family)
MKTAINYSAAARRLLEQGAIDFDLWKSAPRPAWQEEARASNPPRPLYLHFPLDVGEPDFAEKNDWDEIARQLDETDTPFLNVHLNARREHFPEVSGDTKSAWNAVRDQFLRHLSLVTERFGAERIIAENVIYRGAEGQYLRASVEPELITEVVAQSGCGLLLDTAHARITCAYLDTPVEAYIEALPVAQLRELHVTGTQHDGNRLRDSMPLSEEDWATVRWVLSHVHAGRWPAPWVAALEYGGIGSSYEWRSDPQVIAKELPILQGLVSSLDSGR